MSPAKQSVPRKGIPEPSFAVHEPSETGPSRPSVQPSDRTDEDHCSSTPPPYSGPSSSSMSLPTLPRPQPSFPGLPRLNYALYSPQGFSLSSDKTTVTSQESRLSTYPTALVSLIQSLATVPPKPQVRITGKTADTQAADFDVKINMMNLILPEDERSGRMNYVKIIGNGELGYRGEMKESAIPARSGGLDEWARTYCEDQSSIKQFALERTVINWDTSYLEGRLLSLIASTSYRGHVTVSFPVTHNRVLIHSPDKVNRFFSSVTKVFTGTKKYEIIKSVWPYADVTRGEQGRRCVVQEEEVWFRNWSDSIKQAVMSRRKGWVTVEDRLEFLMEAKVVDGVKPPEWGSR